MDKSNEFIIIEGVKQASWNSDLNLNSLTILIDSRGHTPPGIEN